MKKWLVMVLGTLLLQQNVVFAQEASMPLPYEIDPVATAQAPWKVGEKTSSARCSLDSQGCYRVFLGVTLQGQRVLQELYANGSALTDPFLIKPEISWERIRELDKVENPLDVLDSNLLARYPSGAKNIELTLNEQGGLHMVEWSEEGEVMGEKTMDAPRP